jgi:hypothetical protein
MGGCGERTYAACCCRVGARWPEQERVGAGLAAAQSSEGGGSRVVEREHGRVLVFARRRVALGAGRSCGRKGWVGARVCGGRICGELGTRKGRGASW